MSKSGKLLYNWPDNNFDESLKFHDASQLGDIPYDVAIIGAGIVGSALAYQLSQYKVKVLLVEKNYDVGEGTTKGSSAIIHTGFDAAIDTLESELVTKASLEWPELAAKLKIPLRKCGAIVIAIDEEQEIQLDKVYEKGIKNGVTDIQKLSGKEVKEIEPNVSEKVRGGVLVPRESLADPFSASTAFSEIALQNGTDIILGVEVTAIENKSEKIKTLVTACGKKIKTKRIVNVAGLGSEHLARIYGGEEFDTNPRRGQFLIFDKYSGSEINRIFLPIPTAKTKGVLVAPTIFGNLLAGPTAEDYPHSYENISETTTEQLQLLKEGASKLYPKLQEQPVINIFAGVRSNCKQGSYWIRCNDNSPGIITVAGVRSTGFTSSPALARYLIGKLQDELGLNLEEDPDAIDSRPENKWPGWWKPGYNIKELVDENPDNGKIVCFCEQITKADVIRQLDSPLKPRTLDAIKRRTRAGMGRCQGFDCMVPIAKIISDHCKIPLAEISKRGPGTEISSTSTSNN